MLFRLVDAIRRLRKVRQTLGFEGGGVYKRIDENRELLELLDGQAPEFLRAHPWVVRWLQSHDDFLCQLAVDVPPEDGPFLPRNPHGASAFPRPWPRA